MNKSSRPPKPKGISIEGFWSQLKDKTAKKDNGSNVVNSCDVAEANMAETNVELRERPESKDDWETRFDKWLDRL